MVLTFGFSLEMHGRYALLDELYVEKAWRGRGIGTEAVEFVEEQCRQRGLRVARLEVFDDNVRAQALYERNGFEVDDDRHLMTKVVLGAG